ncbi:unnamed protein product [Prunus armeniaca]
MVSPRTHVLAEVWGHASSPRTHVLVELGEHVVSPRTHIIAELKGHVVSPRTHILAKSGDQPEMHIRQFPSQDSGRYNQPENANPRTTWFRGPRDS